MFFGSRRDPSRSGKRAVLVGPYRVHNFGDDLIGGVIAKHLQGRGYGVTVPRLEAANAKWLGTSFATNYDGVFEAADLIVVGGGGIMSDTAGAKPGASYLEIIAHAAAAGRLEGKRLVVTGVGAGPWVREKSRRLASEVASLADYVGVRDDESSAHLASLGVSVEKIVSGADIALLTREYLRFRPRYVRRIGLQFDVTAFTDLQENPALDAIVDAVGRYANSHADRVVLVSNGRHRSQIAEAAPSAELLRYVSLKSFLPRLAGVQSMFTSHLHLAITAYSQRIPTYSLYVREKTRRFYDQIGHPERAVDMRTATVADFERLISEAESTRWTAEDEATLAHLQGKANRLLEFVR